MNHRDLSEYKTLTKKQTLLDKCSDAYAYELALEIAEMRK